MTLPATLQLPAFGEIHLEQFPLLSAGDDFALLSPDERDRAERSRNPDVRRCFVAARAGLRRHLAARLGCAPAEVQIHLAPRGKPHLAPPHDRSGWHFNLTHTKETALLALSLHGPVGIDAETIHALRDPLALARNCLHPDEADELASLNADGSALSAAFLRLWTRKEALLKAVGTGIANHLALFAVALPPGPDGHPRLAAFDSGAFGIPAAAFHLRDLPVETPLIASLCAISSPSPCAPES